MDISVGLAAIAVALVGASFLQSMRAAAESMGPSSLAASERLDRVERLRIALLLLLIGGSTAVGAAVVAYLWHVWFLGALATLAALGVVVVGLVVGLPMLADPDRGSVLPKKRRE